MVDEAVHRCGVEYQQVHLADDGCTVCVADMIPETPDLDAVASQSQVAVESCPVRKASNSSRSASTKSTIVAGAAWSRLQSRPPWALAQTEKRATLGAGQRGRGCRVVRLWTDSPIPHADNALVETFFIVRPFQDCCRQQYDKVAQRLVPFPFQTLVGAHQVFSRDQEALDQ